MGGSASFGQDESGRVEVLNESGEAVTELVDGNAVRLRVTLPQPAAEEMAVVFVSPGVALPLGACTLPAGASTCQSQAAASLGWYWNSGGMAQPERAISAAANGWALAGPATVRVKPRPVVMVHGFGSSWAAWQTYLGEAGYLAELEVPGFAVGDGRVPGEMNTGRLDAPAGRTHTIAENAAVVGDYVEAVQRQTGAEKVDLLVHSMGGLIARYYIDRVMPENDVAQLIMLGSPMAGTACANLAASLGMYMPAALEIQPLYVTQVFNRQIFRRHGIPFYGLAGTQITDPIQSPCTGVPTDIAVSADSLNSIPLASSALAVLHTDLNLSRDVFEIFVRPLLQNSPGRFPAEPDPALGSLDPQPLQFTRVYTGEVGPGRAQTIVIDIDPNVSVASFGLFDPTRSLEVSVRGASGNVVELSAAQNGLIVVEDPATLIYLGYGFKQPQPGKWEVTVLPGADTPAAGTRFALTARFEGGATLQASTSVILPAQNEDVTLTASLEAAGQDVRITGAEALIRAPDGSARTVQLAAAGDAYQAVFSPSQQGIYGIEVSLRGQTLEGLEIERAAWLTIEAQPARRNVLLGWTALAGLGLLVAALVLLLARRRRTGPSNARDS